MYTPRVLVIFFVWLALTTSACSSTATPTSANASLNDVTSIQITINDDFYGTSDNNLVEPPTWVVPRGADVVASVDNQGNDTHNWAIVKNGVDIPVPFNQGQSSDLLEYGAGMVYGMNRTTITFNAPEEVGEYLVICTVPGHYPSMQGRLRVE